MNSQINGIRFICGVVQSTILANNSTVFNRRISELNYILFLRFVLSYFTHLKIHDDANFEIVFSRGVKVWLAVARLSSNVRSYWLFVVKNRLTSVLCPGLSSIKVNPLLP